MMRFAATAGVAGQLDDLNAFAVVLSEHQDGSGSRIEIQKSLMFDEADREAGLDTYCLSTQTGATYYGGVVSWRMDGNNLDLTLDEDAAFELGVDTDLSIELHLPAETVAEVHAGLRRLLAHE